MDADATARRAGMGPRPSPDGTPAARNSGSGEGGQDAGQPSSHGGVTCATRRAGLRARQIEGAGCTRAHRRAHTHAGFTRRCTRGTARKGPERLTPKTLLLCLPGRALLHRVAPAAR
ncbi:hypothetical protein ScoT_53880 [Streptomyces albidoflavus]|uniref:Uncharacterized protein n=1 Tax=Streptomyces albidoflavus TaxID=1886 RepID=A0AA37C530_9ACTN|nr:hypothetical protein ScoT_53880 [Streptomyces albidoflavus]